jgi:hypothetical protein
MAFEHWEKLLYGIQQGECILFVGPELPLVPRDGERRVPARALADRLVQDLGADGAVDAGNLARISQRYLAREDEVGLEMEVTRWHEVLAGERSSVHDDLAALPFRWIVTSGHDPLMETALREAGKTPEVERYHYRGRNKELLPEPTAEAPVLFHLYGRAAEPRSVVLSQTQLLDFLTALISRDPPLPNDLNAALTNGRLFLFLGFGLERWYLRILLHVLKVLKSSRSFAVENLEDGGAPTGEEAILFYRENFRVDVLYDDVCEFVAELRRRYRPPDGAGPEGGEAPPRPVLAPAAPKVFICHASEDHERAREVHDALKRAGFDPWFDREALAGGDPWDTVIESTIREVDYFVVLNSRALVAKAKGVRYVNKEIKHALKAEEYRLERRFIVPARIDGAPLLKQLERLQAVDLTGGGYRDLVRAIRRQEGTA